MAFSDFKTISDVQKQFRIKFITDDIFNVEDKNPSEQFLQEHEFNRQFLEVYASEGSRCEIVIFPILREIYKEYAEKYGLWVKKTITYDETLNGTPDYIVATRSDLGITVIGVPLVITVEAKKNDFEQGWGQCLAEMVAAQKMNDDTHYPVHGIVTDGKMWEFGQLVGDTFIQNRTNYTVDNLPSLFGAVNTVFKTIEETNGSL